MPKQIVIPEVGESITSGVISAWLADDGAYVERDQPVLELETDKITQELVAPAAGRLKRSAAEGDEVEIGAVVGEIDESAEAPAEASKETPEPSKKQQQAGGGREQESEPQARQAAATAAPGSARGDGAAQRPARPAPQAGANGHVQTAAPHAERESDVRATPLARKVAAEHGVDLSRVPGSGAGGKVREQDVLEAVRTSQAVHPGPSLSGPIAQPERRGVRRERMSPLRQRVAVRLVEAQHTAAMLTTFNECDMSAVIALRKKHKERFEQSHGVGLGFMSFFVKACVAALKKFPGVNAGIVESEDGSPAVEYHDYCDISIAVSTPKGLVVPVVRDCEHLSFAQIESRMKDLAARGREGRLTLEELQGGTFTITNGGIFGSLMSTPILNPPQSGILGMHAIRNRAVEDPANPGSVAIRPMMYLALSYDHRLVDGATAVQFLVAVKDAIEQPERLLLDL